MRIREGSKLAEPPIEAKVEYQRLWLGSPEFEPFDVQTEERPETTPYIPLTWETRKKGLFSLFSKTEKTTRKEILRDKSAYRPNTRRVIIVANTVFEREDLPNLEQAEQWIQTAQASAIEFGFRKNEIILLKD